jgi:beta-xylosidase
MKFSSVLAALSAVSSALAQQTYTNPVLWYDLADIDVFRKGNQYYYSASTMSFSPGAPILRSGDLVNWEFIGHSVPRLDFHDTAYDLADNKQAYVRGIWASSMQYREFVRMRGYIYHKPNPTRWPFETLETTYRVTKCCYQHQRIRCSTLAGTL